MYAFFGYSEYSIQQIHLVPYVLFQLPTKPKICKKTATPYFPLPKSSPKSPENGPTTSFPSRFPRLDPCPPRRRTSRWSTDPRCSAGSCPRGPSRNPQPPVAPGGTFLGSKHPLFNGSFFLDLDQKIWFCYGSLVWQHNKWMVFFSNLLNQEKAIAKIGTT